MRKTSVKTAITADGRCFRDRHGRHVILRGVNLGGDCKGPASPDGHTYRRTDFGDHRTVSFVGRPFPLAEADAHLGRLARWGFNCLRLLTTWEAVEHDGPGVYDEEYLDYFAALAHRATDLGFYVFIDFHQDVWARMAGGDGAPGWTFEVAGLDFTRFDAADAAHVMAYRYDEAAGGLQETYPQMSWAGNYRMPANAIMWTLFFAGSDLAPLARIDGVNVGTYLQDHYLGAMAAVARRVADMPNVIGFDTLNEPGSGWIGHNLDERQGLLRGLAWSPLDALAVASGLSRTLPLLEGGERVVNPDGVSIWLEGRDDPFRAAGVWSMDESGPRALKPNHFAMRDGVSIDIGRDYMRPFYTRVAETVRAIREDWLIFAEADPFGGHGLPDGLPPGMVNASHWYDLTTLVTKRFTPWTVKDLLSGATHESREAVVEHYTIGLARIADLDASIPGGAPCLVGEFGIPFDLNNREAYCRWEEGKRTNDIWEVHVAALSAMYDALDNLLLSSTQWNYTASNRNDPMVGDGWNQEDLSIWSADQIDHPPHPDSGARALAGFCRPYIRAAQGQIIFLRWDGGSNIQIIIDIDGSVSEPTCIYIPPRFSVSKVLVDGREHEWASQNSLVTLFCQSGLCEVEILLEVKVLPEVQPNSRSE